MKFPTDNGDVILEKRRKDPRARQSAKWAVSYFTARRRTRGYL